MSSDSEWVDEEKRIDYCGLLEVLRESGDGESKETSPHTSASEDDNQETKQALIDVNRKVERRKDKKISKIPVWQAKPSHHADVAKSTYGNSCHSQQLDFAEKAGISEEIFYKICDKRQSDAGGNKIQTDPGFGTFSYDDSEVELRLKMSDFGDRFAIPIANSFDHNELNMSTGEIKLAQDNVTNLDNTNVSEIEREELECERAAISEYLELKQLDIEYGYRILKENENNPVESVLGNTLLNSKLQDDLGDIIRDISAVPEITAGSAEPSSLGPRAPLASVDLDDHILEAPEEFRSLHEATSKDDNSTESVRSDEIVQSRTNAGEYCLQLKEPEDETAFHMSHTDLGEPKQCRTGASARDHDKANTPEANNVCGRESNKDMPKNVERGIETGIVSNRQEPKPLQICMTNEGKHRVIQLEALDRKVNANGCAKFAAPCETIEIMRDVGDSQRVFTDTNGGVPKDNDQIQSDSINASETKPHVDVTVVSRTCEECVGDVSSPNGGAAVLNNTVEVTHNCKKGMVRVPDKETNEYVELRNDLRKLLVSRTGADVKVGGSTASKDEAIRINGGSSNGCNVTLSSVSEPCADNSCPEGRDSVNGPNSSVSDVGAYACAGNEQTLATAKASIAIGVARCAQAPRCSRISAVTVSAASTADSSNFFNCSQNSPQVNCSVTEKCEWEAFLSDNLKENDEIYTLSDTHNNQEGLIKTESADVENSSGKGANKNFSDCASEKSSDTDIHLVWEFKNGRLVFDTSLDTESERASVKQSEQSSRPTQVSQCQSKGTTPPLLQVIEECAEKIENSVNRISKDSPSSNVCDTNTDEVKDVLFSRDLNRRVVEGRSRLKHLENKLKEAGITDGKTNVPSDVNQPDGETCKYKSSTKHTNEVEVTENKEKVEQVVDKLTQSLGNENLGFDDNQNVVYSEPGANDLKSEIQSGESEEEEEEDLLPETDESVDQIDFAGGSRCEFDVRQVGSFSGFTDSDFFVVYDELEDGSNDEDECEHEHYHIISEMRGDGSMGTDGERSRQHNPDRENLKSLLKKPGRGRDNKRNRVVFNENKNEFFDADYIILIREECDYDDEEDDGVCTCNEHEMVRLTCCEPNCNCNLYEGYSDPTPQSPKFAPPLEFVDAVTLSPPEGYKDMELGEQQLFALQQMARRGQRTAVCRDCSATHEDDGEGSQSDNEDNGEIQSDHDDGREEAEKTDQSQQTTPTTPPAENESPDQHQYILETVTMTTVTERRIMREMEDEKQRPSSPNLPPGGSPISGILKGGRLWKQHSQEANNARNIELLQTTDSSVTSDEESNGNRRSVRFIESNENKRDVCDGAVDKPVEETRKQDENLEQNQSNSCNNSVSPESTEMMLTFKLGNHILISNNSLKPNSAVRQLFPCSKPLSNKPGENDSVHQYLVTAESLRAFEEAKRSKLPQIIQSDETDESIKRAIERNTLRRSLIRYEPRPKKKEQKTDNSLVERIKQLTCDVDDVIQEPEDIPQRASPPGEEARKSPEVNNVINKNNDKSFSPSSSSTASSNSSSVSSTYKKITDLFAKREKPPDIQNNTIIDPNVKTLNQLGPAPDLGNTGPHQQDYMGHHCPVTKANSSSEARKQFLSTLAPLTACVSSTGADDHYYHVSHHTGDRASVTSSVGTEYSLEDIDEGLKNEDDDSKRNAPDVVVGTPSASESGDELAMFVQQDASRIERIKKKYQQDNSEDDEHDDYGFNKRPSVRGIKPRFGTTTEILQQIQNQMQPPQTGPKTSTHVAWPYYSEASLSGLDNNKSRNINQTVPQYQYTYVTEEMKTKMYVQQYRPTTLMEDNLYQNCTNQRCNREVAYKANVNHVHSPVMRIGGGCSEIYQAVPNRARNGRPESPPPFDVARNVHQTMVYIPYNHIESYQPSCVSPNPQYVTSDKCYARVVNQNQINRYVEPVYHNQPRMNHPQVVDETHYQVNVMKQIPKPMIRLPYPLPSSQAQPHLMSSRSDSPLPGQFSTARSTQTSAPTMSTCNYYPTAINPRYRPAIGPVVAHAGVVWNNEAMYANKVNRHSFPTSGPRYPAPDNISLTDSESQYSGPVPNGFRQTIETTFSAQKDSVPNSPTKPRFIERGVPEGAASVSPQDSTVAAQSTSTMTSPTSPQNPQQGNPKPLFYAMNV